MAVTRSIDPGDVRLRRADGPSQFINTSTVEEPVALTWPSPLWTVPEFLVPAYDE